MNEYIKITNSRVHNLKNISIDIPKNKIVAIVGPSGSGKTSLAYHTLYKEGQRKYIESLSSYSQKYLEQFQPADVDNIEGLSPSVAITLKNNFNNPRSTVGTLTGIYDLLRILFTNIGNFHCPTTGELITAYSPSKLTNLLINNFTNEKLILLSPINIDNNTPIESYINKFQKLGFNRVQVNNEILLLDEVSNINTTIKKFSIVIDRIVLKESNFSRLLNSIELAYKVGQNRLITLINDSEVFYSDLYMNASLNIIYPNLTPSHFSFNDPNGKCSQCNGEGVIQSIDENNLIFDKTLSISDGAIHFLNAENSYLYEYTKQFLKLVNSNIDTTLNNIDSDLINKLLLGTKESYKFNFQSKNKNFEFEAPFIGIKKWIIDNIKTSNEFPWSKEICPKCNGFRLNEIGINTLINKFNISQLSKLTIHELTNFFINLNLNDEQRESGKNLIEQIKYRLTLLNNIGVGYLTLDRAANTLSGGECQRLRLGTQTGTKLSGILYLLDEPSVGIHPLEKQKLIDNINYLKSLGNTVIIIDHDLDLINYADYIIEMGEGAGQNGGEIIFQGNKENFISIDSLTATTFKNYKINFSEEKDFNDYLVIKNIHELNLKNIDIKIPLNSFTSITGLSGSGKSTLVYKVITKALDSLIKKSFRSTSRFTNFQSISGYEKIHSVTYLGQSLIGKNPSSIPATYLSIFSHIREIFANTLDSKTRGYKSKRFSFNVKGGRCESCEGTGYKKIDMHFLADTWILCRDCGGTRYNAETLTILYKGKNIADILNMDVAEALDFFKNHSKINKVLQLLSDLGLHYIKLGQPTNELSGGESQRLRIVNELAKNKKGHTLYILDEPTAGLHTNEIELLLKSLHELINKNNSVITIEHNLKVVSQSDWLIELGPEGGNNGGYLIYEGIPKNILKIDSATAQALKNSLNS